MHPADIKASLEKAGFSQVDIARSVVGRSGEVVTPGAVHMVIKGKRRSAAIARRISEVIGLPVRTLWPGKYPQLERKASR